MKTLVNPPESIKRKKKAEYSGFVIPVLELLRQEDPWTCWSAALATLASSKCSEKLSQKKTGSE